MFQPTNPLPAMLATIRTLVRVLAGSLLIQFPSDDLGKQQRMAQVLGPLPSTLEVLMELLALSI